MTDAEKLHEWRLRQKAAGLCAHCAKPVVPGFSMCEGHRAYFSGRRNTAKHRTYMRKYMAARRARATFVNESGAAA